MKNGVMTFGSELLGENVKKRFLETLGIELEKDVNLVLSECISRGILPIKAKNKLRLLPALNIPMSDLEYAVRVILEVSKP